MYFMKTVRYNIGFMLNVVRYYGLNVDSVKYIHKTLQSTSRDHLQGHILYFCIKCESQTIQEPLKRSYK